MTLVLGQKYFVAVAPWGQLVVRYLGRSRWFPSRSRVQHPITRIVFTVPTDSLRPALAAVDGGDR